MTKLHKIHGKEYKVLSIDSPSDHRKAGRYAIADAMEDSMITDQFNVARPNGRQIFLVNRYENGNISKPVKLDGCYI